MKVQQKITVGIFKSLLQQIYAETTEPKTTALVRAGLKITEMLTSVDQTSATAHNVTELRQKSEKNT